MKHLVMAAIMTSVAVMLGSHHAFGGKYVVLPTRRPPAPGEPNGPPAPDLPADDPNAELLFELVWQIRPVLMKVPHVTDVQDSIYENNDFTISVEVDSTANLPAVQAVIPPTIDGFPVEFGADDAPIYTDIW